MKIFLLIVSLFVFTKSLHAQQNQKSRVIILSDIEADPDGDNLSFLWFHYPEAGSYQKQIDISAENAHGVFITSPKVDKIETLHFILKLTDKGSPALSRYKRVIVTVLPK